MSSVDSRFAALELQKLLAELKIDLRFRELVGKVESSTESGTPLLSLGWSLLHHARPLLALRILVECTRRFPGTVYAYVAMGVSFHRLGDNVKARSCMLQASILLRQHENGMIASALGEAVDQVSLPLTQALFEGNYAPVPSHVKPSEEGGQSLYQLGLNCVENHVAEGALTCFMLATEAQPNLAQAHAEMGLCLSEQGRQDEAVPCLVRSLEINGDDAVTLNGFASVLLALDFPALAIRLCRRALELRPDYDKADRLLQMSQQAGPSAEWREAMNGIWGPARVEALATDPLARRHVREAEKAGPPPDLARDRVSCCAIRSFALAVEAELRSVVVAPAIGGLCFGVLKPVESLSLSDMVGVLREGYENTLSGERSACEAFRPEFADRLGDYFSITREDLQVLANRIGTMSYVNGACVQGDEMVPGGHAAVRRLVLQCLEAIMDARISRIVGKPAAQTDAPRW